MPSPSSFSPAPRSSSPSAPSSSAEAAGYYDHARTEILPYLPEHCGSLLELGCSSGATLAAIRKARAVETAIGVELDEGAASRARGVFDEVHHATLDDFDFEGRLGDRRFDVVLALDVLEHLVDPWATVREVSKRLTPEGVLIAVVPNLRHRSVVKDLVLRGDFSYVDAGILDRTHLRFFVRKTAIELCESGGLEVRTCATRKKLKRLRKWMSRLTGGWAEDFHHQQFILVAGHPRS